VYATPGAVDGSGDLREEPWSRTAANNGSAVSRRTTESSSAVIGHGESGPGAQAHGSLTRKSLLGLLVLLSDLMLFVGLWDLIDYVLLEQVPYCGAQDDEGSWCVSEVALKFSIGAIGALGLFATGGLAAAADGFFW